MQVSRLAAPVWTLELNTIILSYWGLSPYHLFIVSERAQVITAFALIWKIADTKVGH